MASITDICNVSLNNLGSPGRVASISPPDGTSEADLCSRYYPIALKEILEVADWSFARRRATLATLSTNPSLVWAYAYAIPSDCLTPQRILSNSAGRYDLDSAAFDIEGTTLFSDTAAAVLTYTSYVVDTNLMSQAFTTTFTYLLSSLLAGPIIRGSDGANASKKFREVYMLALKSTVANDANKGDTKLSQTPSLLAARDGSGGTGGTPAIYAVYGGGYVVN